MTNDNLFLLIPLIIITLISLFLALYAWGRKFMLGAKSISLILASIAIWTFGYSLEIIALNIDQKIFWLTFEYIGILIIPVAFLRLGILVSQTKKFNNRFINTVSGLSSFLLLLLVFTNSNHHWFQSDYFIAIYKNVPLLTHTKGPVFWIINISIYVHFTISFILLFSSYSPQNKLMRNQYLSIFVAAIPPLLANIINVFGIMITPLVDITPFAMFFSGVSISFGFFKFKLLDITPIARNKLIDNMHDGVLVISPEKLLIDANPSVKNMFAFMDDSVLGKNIKEVFNDKPEFIQGLEKNNSTTSPYSFHLENNKKTYEVNISSLKDKSIGILGYLIVFQDVTKELEIEKAKKDIEEKYETLIKQSPIAIGIHSEGKVVYFNQAGLELFGAKNSEEVLGKDLFSFIHPDSYEIVRERVRQSIVEKKIGGKVEEKMVRLDGQTIEVETTNHPIIFNGKPASHVTLIDNTARNKNKRKRQRQFNELSVLHSIAILGSKTNNEDELIEKATKIIGEIIYTDNFGLLLVEDSVLVKEHHTYVRENRENELVFHQIGLGVTGKVAQTGEMINIPDVSKNKNYISINSSISSELCVPIKIKNEVVGLINAESKKLNAFSEDDEQFLLTLADQISIVLEKIRLFNEIQRLARTDFLTSISNRRNFDEIANNEFERSKRYQNNLNVIILDIDNFKKVNDTHGHAIGDEILKATAEKINEQLRDTDILARYGGEEFAILCPQTDMKSTNIIAERLLKAFNQNPIKTINGLIEITVSIGIAELTENVNNFHDLLNNADKALYQAKETGRNKICIFQADKIK